jgi:uncharacterized protein (UPF0332 family)
MREPAVLFLFLRSIRIAGVGEARFPKHSGVKSLFNRHFVKTGKVSKEDGRLYNKLFEARLEGDYVDYVVFDQATVKPWIGKVRGFIETVSRLLEQGS